MSKTFATILLSRSARALLVCCVCIGCAHDAGTITPQAQAAISRLPKPVIDAFRHDFSGVTSAHARTRVMPDQRYEYEIDFVGASNQRHVARYLGDGKRIE